MLTHSTFKGLEKLSKAQEVCARGVNIKLKKIGNVLTFRCRSTSAAGERFCKLYPANTWGVRGGGRLSLSVLSASMVETVQDRISRGYFCRMPCTSRSTPFGQERRSACRLWAASISVSCRLLRPDSSSRLRLSSARAGLVGTSPCVG